ncbi:MAG: riboflavin synthase [Candidatus Margulisiibacteriota bacterium]|nr:MAG: riboflavin synthase subunit alpha [Candidatus Margulisbacteria bacterium GWD2_39_127]PZM78727.1 MAG: riboflavin synthase [Candidatus Margulisiibacteriota bacterium]HAR62132.1 riboflavin synthase [Candidatus Margulisiibacteriota bacterium]HCY35625.1 riboflavin synthase [Candidatus Margulisiibacteriota bacterium]
MFTGIIEELGSINRISKKGDFFSLEVNAVSVLEETDVGDSISVNGVCLTVTSLTEKSFHCDVMSETIHRSVLQHLYVGAKVNLERSLTLRSRLGGHLVSGHVDGIGVISVIEFRDNSQQFTIKTAKDLLLFIAPKGSVAIDGISLTVVDVQGDSFSVSIIPHTIKNTTLHDKRQGDKVNIEVDLLARYVVNYIGNNNRNHISWEDIAKVGF